MNNLLQLNHGQLTTYFQLRQPWTHEQAERIYREVFPGNPQVYLFDNNPPLVRLYKNLWADWGTFKCFHVGQSAGRDSFIKTNHEHSYIKTYDDVKKVKKYGSLLRRKMGRRD